MSGEQRRAVTGGTQEVGPSGFGINTEHRGRGEEEDRTAAQVRAVAMVRWGAAGPRGFLQGEPASPPPGERGSERGWLRSGENLGRLVR